MWKNFLWMWRNAPVMAFIIGLPVAQIILFCFSIGHDPTGLKVSIVNNELNLPEENICNPVPGCNSSRLSCNYIEFLKQRTLIPVSYPLQVPKHEDSTTILVCRVIMGTLKQLRMKLEKEILGQPLVSKQIFLKHYGRVCRMEEMLNLMISIVLQ